MSTVKKLIAALFLTVIFAQPLSAQDNIAEVVVVYAKGAASNGFETGHFYLFYDEWNSWYPAGPPVISLPPGLFGGGGDGGGDNDDTAKECQEAMDLLLKIQDDIIGWENSKQWLYDNGGFNQGGEFVPVGSEEFQEKIDDMDEQIGKLEKNLRAAERGAASACGG